MLIDTITPIKNKLAAIEKQDFDLARFLAASRARQAKAQAERKPRALSPAISADPCRRCGISGRKGCDHQGPYVEPVVDRRAGSSGANPRIGRGRR